MINMKSTCKNMWKMRIEQEAQTSSNLWDEKRKISNVLSTKKNKEKITDLKFQNSANEVSLAINDPKFKGLTKIRQEKYKVDMA